MTTMTTTTTTTTTTTRETGLGFFPSLVLATLTIALSTVALGALWAR